MNFLNNPNLPEGKVTFAAVSSECADVIEALNGAHIGTLNIEPCSILPRGIASHADLQLLHLGNNKVAFSSLADSSQEMLRLSGFETYDANSLGSEYPNDCKLNSAIFGKYILLNEKAAAPILLQYVEENNLTVIHTRQGYANCSVLIAAKDAIITADEGIADALNDYDIDVLKINPGNIFLPGYDTGFIGGVGGMIEKGIMGTAGSLSCLKNDGDNIISFLRNRNIYCENLGKKELRDIGGILPLCESE